MTFECTVSTFASPAPGVSAASGMMLTPLRNPSPNTVDNQDLAVISQLQKHGADVGKPTEILYFLYIPNRDDACRAALTLTTAGFPAHVESPLGKLPDGSVSSEYGIVARTTDSPPTMTVIRRARLLFEALAKAYHGKYDGWEAAVTK